MPTGLRISVNGEFFTFIYTLEDVQLNNMDLHATEVGNRDFGILEQWSTNNKTYLICGWAHGFNFNAFELEYVNNCGDIIIYCVSAINNTPMNVDVIDVRDHYREIDLDEFIIEDELDFDTGEYDLDDEFINSSVLDSDDYLDFIDYP